ncbi:hypothetical protein GCM10028807_20870 [Spirosoma daeguense]
MKLVYSVLLLNVCIAGASVAQTQPKPASTSTNRQQELYDQYHGISKKSSSTTTTTTTTSSPAPVANRPTTAEQSAPMVASRTQSTDEYGSTSGVRIGVRGGVTYLAYLEEQRGVESAIGFTGGVTFNFGAGTLSFQPEINYSRYSQKVAILGTSTYANDLIEVPLFLKISSGTYDGNRFFLNIGPYGAYLASSSIDGKKRSLEGTSDRFMYGAAAGIGADLKAGPGHFTVEVRGLYGLGTIDSGFDADSKTILAQAAIGYKFPLGGR